MIIFLSSNYFQSRSLNPDNQSVITYLCRSLSLDDLEPLRVVEPELLPPHPVPPGVVVQGDDVQRGVAQLLHLRVPIVHQIDLKIRQFDIININILTDLTAFVWLCSLCL